MIKGTRLPRASRLWRTPFIHLSGETKLGILFSAYAALLLTLAAVHAGPLWRDEVNSINVAQMHSAKLFWGSLTFESFPAVWLLLLRFWNFIGLGSSDVTIRFFGFIISLAFLASLWVSSKCLQTKAPTLSFALVGTLPVFIYIAPAIRAYGLALCFLSLTFGLVWHLTQKPSKLGMLWVGIVSIVFAHILYYDIVFLFAILGGGILLCLTKSQRRTAAFLLVTGMIASTSLLIYLPLIRSRWPTAPRSPAPFDLSFFWGKLGSAVAMRTSAEPDSVRSGPEIWVWLFLIAVGAVSGIWKLAKAERARRAHDMTPYRQAGDKLERQRELVLFSLSVLVTAFLGYASFLFRIQYRTERWYYIELLTLSALCLEALLNAACLGSATGARLRTGLLAGFMAWSAGTLWAEAHTRRTNIDLVAAFLQDKAGPNDLVLVQGPFEAITFDRYYHGTTRWNSVPPVADHKLHRTDLIWHQLLDSKSLGRFLQDLEPTLKSGHNVWVIGEPSLNLHAPASSFDPKAPKLMWLGTPLECWGDHLTATLVKLAGMPEIVNVPCAEPVSRYEDVALLRFSSTATTNSPRQLSL